MFRTLPQVLDGDPVEFQFGSLTTELVAIWAVAHDLRIKTINLAL